MTRSASPQAKALTKYVIGRLLLQISIFSVIYLTLILLFSVPIERAIVQFADTYAPWTYYQSPLEYFEQRGLIGQSSFDANGEATHTDVSALYSASYMEQAAAYPTSNELSNDDIQIQPGPNGGVFVRDMSLVNTLRALRLPFAIAFYMVVLILLFSLSLRRVLYYLDDLSLAVQRTLLEPTEPVALPNELLITQETLEIVRQEKIAREEEARDAEKRKNELVAYLAHDIRTPLTSVIGYLDLLKEDAGLSQEKKNHYLNVAYAKSLRLNELVNEFFEITRLNVGGNDLLIQTANLNLFVAQVLEEVWPLADAKHILFKTEIDKTIHIQVDPQQFARAVSNIFKNAISYADSDSVIEIKGYVQVPDQSEDIAEAAPEEEAMQATQDKVKAAPENRAEETVQDGVEPVMQNEIGETGTNMIALSITDQGKEIAPENLERIFERFYREDTARHMSKGGAGLGLSIASEIVQAHGGFIRAKSSSGLTTFILYLPYCTVDPNDA